MGRGQCICYVNVHSRNTGPGDARVVDLGGGGVSLILTLTLRVPKLRAEAYLKGPGPINTQKVGG